MREALAIPTATLSCAATAAISAAAAAWWFERGAGDDRIDFGLALFFAFGLSIPYVVIIGLPIGLFLVHKQLFRPFPALVAGTVAASPLPFILLISALSPWPPQLADVRSALIFLVIASIAGAVSGLVFYGTHRLVSPNNSFKPRPLRGSATW